MSEYEHTQENPLDNSRPLDVHRWSEYPEVKAATVAICNELGYTWDKDKAHCRVIILDLYHCHLHDHTMYIGISLNSRSYEMDDRYNRLHIKYDVLDKVVKALREHEYIEFHTGFLDRNTGIGRQTRIKATRKLIQLIRRHHVKRHMITKHVDEEIIKFRDVDEKGNQKDIPYDEAADIIRLRYKLRAYNELLAEANITLAVRRHKVDLTRKKIHRVFNDGSWTKGGRFFGGFWIECPKELRPHIQINGEPTVELDFSGMHIHFLYALEGINYADKQEDAYTLEGYDDRPLLKQLMLIFINSTGTRQNVIHTLWTETIEPNPDNYCIKTRAEIEPLLEAFERKHAAISKYFRSGIGTRLQYIDSLIAEDIINFFTRVKIPVLSVHDSFITAEHHYHLLKDQMWTSYYKVVKFRRYKSGRIACKLDGKYNYKEDYIISDNTITIK
jgi:hypothetical protein